MIVSDLRTPSPWIVAAVTALGLGLLSACGSDPSTGSNVNPDATDASAEADDSDVPSIRDVDFGGLEWREAVNGLHIVPAEDSEPDIAYSIGDEIAYADVNGDGHEDALVALHTDFGQAVERIWYIWTWDPDTETAVQVENPIARDMRCGDVVLSVAAGDEAFEIHERLLGPSSDTLSCADEPPIEVRRSVTLADGWPILTNALGGYGGICPQPSVGTDDAFPIDGFTVYADPGENTALDHPEITHIIEVDVWGHQWLFRENWMLVHFIPNSRENAPAYAAYGDYLPCGWAYLEFDDRPIPHTPHFPE